MSESIFKPGAGRRFKSDALMPWLWMAVECHLRREIAGPNGTRKPDDSAHMHHDPQFYRIRNHPVNFLVDHPKKTQEEGRAPATPLVAFPDIESPAPSATH